MAGVSFGLAEYRTGDRILDLPVMEGASWAALLNRPDALSCTLDLRDPDVRALDIPSTTEPKKTVLFAQAPNGAVLAWGVISDREWNDDKRELTVNASGGLQYFNSRNVAPPAAYTATDLVLPDGKVNTAYDTVLTDYSLGGIGVKLLEQALAHPGSPVAFVLPVAEAGTHERTYRLVDYKKVGAALTDLTKVEDGPDFRFGARVVGGLSLEYVVEVGDPYIGTYAGSWAVGAELSPVSGLNVTDDAASVATHVWMQAGRTDSKVLVSREVNDELLTLAGYPTLDLTDTSHTDVTKQSTLDSHARELAAAAAKIGRTVTFNVKGDAASLPLGQYAPGDWAALDVARGNLYLAPGEIPIRITGISGDETGVNIKIACEVGSKP